jgi:hypothetical protein
MTTEMAEKYLVGARVVAEFLARPEVAAAWTAPSALAEFRVSGLAGHLASQVTNVPGVLALPPATDAPIPLPEHYARSSWVGAPPDAPTNVIIREGGERIAEAGPEALAAATAETADALAATLTAEPADRVVHLPWTGWSLALPDYLTTRLMEIAVHLDDLAVSVGVTTPELPTDVIAPVFSLLTAVAAGRHGQAAVLRALSRAERAPASVNAF